MKIQVINWSPSYTNDLAQPMQILIRYNRMNDDGTYNRTNLMYTHRLTDTTSFTDEFSNVVSMGLGSANLFTRLNHMRDYLQRVVMRKEGIPVPADPTPEPPAEEPTPEPTDPETEPTESTTPTEGG